MLIRNEEGVRWLPLALAAVATVAVGYAAYERWWPHDSATEITVDEVLDRYRDEIGTVPAPSTPAAAAQGTPPRTEAPPATASAASTAPTTVALVPPGAPTTVPAPPLELPAAGVYVYATEGREHITALGGTEHVYPAQTTLTVTSDGCGVQLRWDLLAERYEEWSLCIVDGAVTLQPSGVQFHQFYGQAQTDVSECRLPVPLYPAPPPGTAIARDCDLAGEAWNPVWTAAEPGQVEIADATVATTAFDVTVTLTGEYPENSWQRWTLAPNGLPVAIEFAMESANPSPVGSVTYTETITATLTDLAPLS